MTDTISVFITGAAGTPGRAATRQLAAAGYKVIGAAEGSAGAAVVRAAGGLPAYPDATRAGELRSILMGSKVKVIVHCAPQSANGVPHVPVKWDAGAVEASAAAVVEAAKASGVEYIVHTSYAFIDAVQHDEDAPEALTALVHAALAAEKTVLSGGIPACVLRFGFLYGPDSPALTQLYRTLRSARPAVYGDDHAATNFLHADDAAAAIVLAVQKRPSNVTFTVVDDRPITTAAFLRAFGDGIGMNAVALPGFAAKALIGAAQWKLLSLHGHADNAAAKEVLGWRPRFASVQAGIDDLLLTWRASEAAKV